MLQPFIHCEIHSTGRYIYKEKIILFICSHYFIVADSLESANSSILAACRLFKEVVGKKIRIL